MRPVTHVALVAVKRLSTSEVLSPVRVAKGSDKATVPMIIAHKKLNITSCAGESFLISLLFAFYGLDDLLEALAVIKRDLGQDLAV